MARQRLHRRNCQSHNQHQGQEAKEDIEEPAKRRMGLGKMINSHEAWDRDQGYLALARRLRVWRSLGSNPVKWKLSSLPALLRSAGAAVVRNGNPTAHA